MTVNTTHLPGGVVSPSSFPLPAFMTWTQNYNPLDSELFSALAAAVPIVVLLGLLASGRVAAPWAALAGLLSAILVAVFVSIPIEVESGQGSLGDWAGTVLTA